MSDSNGAREPEVQLDQAALQALIEHAPDAIFVADLQGRYVYVNEAACRMLGYTRGELLGRTILDDIPARDAGRLARSREAMLQGKSHAAEWTLLRKDGTQVFVEVNANILASGQWQGFVRDISERKAHEEERAALFMRIQAERRRLKSVIDSLPVGVLLYEPGGGVIANPRTEELLGTKVVPAAGSAQYAGRIFRPGGEPVPAHELLSARVPRGETVIAEEFLVQRPDGSRIPIIASGAPLTEGDGSPAGGVGVFLDISERVRLEQSVRESERLLQAVFDILPVGLWIADRAGTITRTNPAAHQIWQGSSFARPQPYEKFKAWWVDSGQPIAPDEWGLVRALRTGETSRRELIRIQCLDGSFKTVINWAMPIRSQQGEIAGAVAVNEDVTALYQTQEQLRAAVRDREEILAVVSHDLRSPLGAIMTLAATLELSARGLPGGERVLTLAARLIDITQQMSELVNDLLAVAVLRDKSTALHLGLTNALALLEKAVATARPLFDRDGIALEVVPVGELPMIRVDANRILRVFANLLDNARKFTARGGSVMLTAEAQSTGVRYCVANSGPALTAAQLESMFLPFWQSGTDRRGMGLGLSICRSIVEAHGGSIWAEPMAGKRVRICVLLPSGKPNPLGDGSA